MSETKIETISLNFSRSQLNTWHHWLSVLNIFLKVKYFLTFSVYKIFSLVIRGVVVRVVLVAGCSMNAPRWNAGQVRARAQAATHFHHFLSPARRSRVTVTSASRDARSCSSYSASRRSAVAAGQSVSMCTKEEGKRPRRSGSDSRMPSIQFSSSVSSARMTITSPSSNVSSSSLSASQSYSARHLR